MKYIMAVVFLLLTSCVAPHTQTQTTLEMSDVLGAWCEVGQDSALRLDFDPSRVQVSGACNALSATYVIEHHQGTFGNAQATRMLCEPPLMDNEARATRLLGGQMVRMSHNQIMLKSGADMALFESC